MTDSPLAKAHPQQFCLQCLRFAFQRRGVLFRQGSFPWLTGFAVSLAQVLLPTIAVAQNTYLHTYPPAVVQDFVRGCESAGQSQRFCTCTIDRIQATFSLSEFTALSRQMLAMGSPPRSVMRLMVQCLDTPPPSTITPTPTQASQLNAQLQSAVNARDWDRAIQIVDQMMVLFPQQSAELAAYRSRLEALRGR
jgi:hypothetical protein